MKQKPQQAEIVRLYRDTSDELRRLLVCKLGNRQEAEEIAHDAYLKLCRLEHKGDIRDLRKYLFTMSVRLALNVLRRRKVEKHHAQFECADNDHGEPAAENMSVYHILLAEQKLEAVKEALAELPENTRRIFLFHRFEGLSYVQIAKRLDLSVKTVEYHMKRALQKVMQATEVFTLLDE